MIVILLPGFAGHLTGRPQAAEPASASVPQPFDTAARSNIFVCSVNLADAFVKLRPSIGSDSTETLELAKAINEAALAVGKERDIPASALCSALEAIKGAVDTVPTSGAASTPSAELEHVRRSLAMLTGDHSEANSMSRVALLNEETVRVLMPTGSTWDVELERMPNPSVLLKFVQDLTAKRWVTRDIIRDFVATVCQAKGWEIYDLGAEFNQERAGA